MSIANEYEKLLVTIGKNKGFLEFLENVSEITDAVQEPKDDAFLLPYGTTPQCFSQWGTAEHKTSAKW
ncbi:hypothetical protein JYT95_01585 [bacterium AH-315-J23]|nr:hypothetical protein [bacterium AH-315-J23]PHQ66573.1 MAG: hypothetical protein COB92_07400 [Robiginitomaculum sp.]